MCPLTIPLVTVRFWLDRFVNRGVIGNAEVDYAMSALRDFPLKNRTQKEIAMRLAGMPIAEGIGEEENTLTHPIYDIKAHDARYLLHSLNTG